MSSSSADVSSVSPKRLIAIGNFDGVHIGHQYLLRSVIERAEERALVPTVFTFDPHPAAVLGRQRPGLLTSLPRKLELLRQTSPQLQIIVHTFDRKLANLSPRAFAEKLAFEHAAKEVIVGGNFRFGKDRVGNLETLQELGNELGFVASATKLLSLESDVVSSSRIRKAISDGQLELAERMLGRPHSVSGVVTNGDGRGRELGFRTANLAGVPELLPKEGVYAVRVSSTASSELGGVLNIGVRPTLGMGELRIEVHLLDFAGDLYGQELRLSLIRRLREERKFESLEALRTQIAQDVERARVVLQ